jgi:4-diphosphocytidyl-2-C-methyl-D-erythritol kinase
LNSIKHQVRLCDQISIEESPALEIICEHPRMPRDQTNICWKAVDLVRKEFGIKSGARLHIEKRIPIMGGLAGGSSNAAATLNLCNRLWDLSMSDSRMMELGRRLGMDVPYYFMGGTAFDTEATGILEPIHTDISLWIILALPDFGVSTRKAYESIDYARIGKARWKTTDMRSALQSGNINILFDSTHNDFEIFILDQYPELKRIKQLFLMAGCKAAVMSGSGSTMLGIAETQDDAKRIARSLPYQTILTSSHTKTEL